MSTAPTIEELRSCLSHMHRHDPHGLATQLTEAELERRENRALFFNVLHCPDMRFLVKALQYLRYEDGIDIGSIAAMEIIPPSWPADCWVLVTDRFKIVSLYADDFLVVWFHDPQRSDCKCDACTYERYATQQHATN